jgi:hypothetical protein
MVWLLMLMVYEAPANAVDWDGPWKLGLTKVVDTKFTSEAECTTFAIRLIGKMHDGMLAPMRYRCVPADASLPKERRVDE